MAKPIARPTTDVEQLRLRIQELEARIYPASMKLQALAHLFSQYDGELEFSDAAAHGLALVIRDINGALTGDTASDEAQS